MALRQYVQAVLARNGSPSQVYKNVHESFGGRSGKTNLDHPEGNGETNPVETSAGDTSKILFGLKRRSII
jgi:hypothetical protein